MFSTALRTTRKDPRAKRPAAFILRPHANLNSVLWRVVVVCLLVLAGRISTAGEANRPGSDTGRSAEHGKLLWQIGLDDDNTAELALAPDGYNRFGSLKSDPLFVVDAGDCARDWPYVHPGPADAWAGSRPHEFIIAFSLKSPLPADATCRLLVDLVDTHDRQPPLIVVTVNGRELAREQAPPGGPDATVLGDPSKGREHRFSVKVPAEALRPGLNEIVLRTEKGSWVLYDWLGFESPATVRLAATPPRTMVVDAAARAVLVERAGKLLQPVRLHLRHYGAAREVVIHVPGTESQQLSLHAGDQTTTLLVPAVDERRSLEVEVRAGDELLAQRSVELRPARRWTVYLLPHSHVDIGYTKVQTEVERDHWRFIEQAIDASRKTADYPAGARFKWNVEVLWAVDSYLRQATPEKQQQFVEAVRRGWIGLDALYGNELTALCRPEELVRLVDFAQQLSARCGVKINSAMITDVPGYTWGITSVLGQAGVKYFHMGPNGSARIGFTHQVWDEKPFWWASPCGRYRILCHIPERGYYRTFARPEDLLARLERLEESGYPYEVVIARYCLGDNAGPGIELSDRVRRWNEQHAYPRLVIATTAEAMRALEERHGEQIPEVRGDFTPYWEDGAASSARETAINRQAAERLTRAEALWAVLRPKDYPAEQFYQAWRNVILYDEHTWGAHNSIRQPDSPFVKAQWAIKQAFALDADKQSRQLLHGATAPLRAKGPKIESVLVWNTNCWQRTDLVVLPADWSAAGKQVVDAEGRPVPTQRLTDGRLAFLASGVPPFGGLRFDLVPGEPAPRGSARAQGNRLVTKGLELAVDPATGAVASLKAEGIDGELVDRRQTAGLNDYYYVPGKDPADAKRAGKPRITVQESGPLVASLRIESEAPGCRRLVRTLRVVDGLDFVAIADLVDKEKVRTKEGVHFAFPFQVPEGVMRMDVPFAVVRPEDDQLPGACKNWFTVQRWIDISNEQYGVTWATVDAPLVEVGAITAETPWIEHLEPTQTLYSYVMNNYWFTNYKADQEGETLFRYAVRPHQHPYDAVAAARFGIERSQPLVVVPCARRAPAEVAPRLRVEPAEVLVTSLKPSRDGKALIVRLFALEKTEARLVWADPQPRRVTMSNLSEEPGEELSGAIPLPRMGLVTLRAEMP